MLIGSDGKPLQSEQAADESRALMEGVMAKVFALLQEEKVPYDVAAGVGVNLLLFFIRQHPNYAGAEAAANHLMSGVHQHLQALLQEILRNEEAAKLLATQPPRTH
jgi:hypothetical protein